MNADRTSCAARALSTVPNYDLRVSADEVARLANGHSFYRGMHIGWTWGVDLGGRIYLDFLSEHRHPGMYAARYFADGTNEPITTPGSMRKVSLDPDQDAAWEEEFIERNSHAYADLRRRGLLPPEGANLMSQELTEYLVTGGREPDKS